MKSVPLYFLILAILSLIFCVTVRIVEDDWYNNIEGQCGFKKNPTCEGWQSSAIIISFLSFVSCLILCALYNGADKEDVKLGESEQ